jgi:two-component system cell cycle response regulator DivK
MQSILVVDDDAASRSLLGALLEQDDRQIFEASQGGEALEITARERPDLVLLDINLPVLDGYGVLKRIRTDPDLCRTTVVAVSADAMPGCRERAIEAGFDEYITKPVKAAALRAQVAHFLAPRLPGAAGPIRRGP